MSTSPYTKEISYDRETRDYKMTLDGQLIGWARTYQEAETALDNVALEWLRHERATAADEAAERAADEDEAPTVDPALASTLAACDLVVTPVQIKGVWVQWLQLSSDVDAPLPFDLADDSTWTIPSADVLTIDVAPPVVRIVPADLDAAYTALATRHAHDKRYLAALERGRDYLRQEGIVNLTETGALLWYGLDGHGDYAPTSQVCQCEAYTRHQVICRHRVAAALLEEMQRLVDRCQPRYSAEYIEACYEEFEPVYLAGISPVPVPNVRVQTTPKSERLAAARAAMLECYA